MFVCTARAVHTLDEELESATCFVVRHGAVTEKLCKGADECGSKRQGVSEGAVQPNGLSGWACKDC
jgi:hypothetical protein